MLFFMLLIYLVAIPVSFSDKMEENPCLKSSTTCILSAISTFLEKLDKCQKGNVINSSATNHTTNQSTLVYKLNKK